MNQRKPYLSSGVSTALIMGAVITALLPSLSAGLYRCGLPALYRVGIAVASAVILELFMDLILRKKPLTLGDYSAVVTGLLIGLLLPPSVPLYYPVIAAAVAIPAVKMSFGGLGRNILNPAMSGILVLYLAFRLTMTDYSGGAYSALTPLLQLSGGNTIRLRDLVLGNCAGPIGTCNAVAILAGAIFLVLIGVYTGREILSAFIGFGLTMVVLGGHRFDPLFLTAHFCGGSFLFVTCFMLPDPVTSPVTRSAKIVYGLLFGVLTGLLRVVGLSEEAAMFALLGVNLLARGLDRVAMLGARKYRRSHRILHPRDEEKEESLREKRQESIRLYETDQEKDAQRPEEPPAAPASETVNDTSPEKDEE